MRRVLTVATGAVAIVGLGLATAPVQAEDTSVSFALAAGALAIEVPTAPATLAVDPSLALVSGATVVSGALGTTTVTDSRLGSARTATVTMTAGAFVNGSSTILASAATGFSGVATPTGVTVPTTTVTGQEIGDGDGATILTLVTALGSGGASYNPTVRVTIPGDAVAGTYTGVISQTVL